jgi:putative membrane protein
MTTLLKFVHLGAFSLWSAGLIVLPFLFRQRLGLAPGPELDRLHRFVRRIHVGVTSPAAFVAIGSGTALIFLQTTFLEWFSMKMALVSAMVMLQVAASLVLAQLFEPGGRFGRGASVLLTLASATLVVAIIWVALAKPHLDSNQIATGLFSPGGLGHFLGDTRTPMP